MLLRRITEHVKAQNWTAVALDFVIVVVGVFVGIQVSNWNAERLERTLERELLVRLLGDFEESIEGQSRDLSFLRQQLSDQAVILSSVDACAVAPEDSEAFQRGINTLGFVNPPRFFRRTVDEMMAAGRTDLIRNVQLKTRLSDIVALVEWRGEAFDIVSRPMEHHRTKIEPQLRYDLGRTYPDSFIGQFVGVDFDIEALCKTPEVANSVSAISYTTSERLRAYELILREYEAFAPVIEAELRARWGVEPAP